MNECFLEALLYDVLGVLSITGHALSQCKNLPPVPCNEQLKCASIPDLRASDQCRVFLCNQNTRGRARRIRSAYRVHDFYWHSVAPFLLALKLLSVGRLHGLAELPRSPTSFSLHLATQQKLISKIEMNRDFHFDSHRHAIKQRWLIFPLQYGLQCRRYQ